jgi:hypothetical protein
MDFIYFHTPQGTMPSNGVLLFWNTGSTDFRIIGYITTSTNGGFWVYNLPIGVLPMHREIGPAR